MENKYSERVTDLGVVFIVKETPDGNIFHIPTDPANSDYQAYLEELEATEAAKK